MKKLYTPIVINKTEFKNRVCMAPMGLGTTDYVDGNVTDRLIDCYVQRAKGGVGMIDIANIMYDPNHLDPVNGPILTDDKYIPSPKKKCARMNTSSMNKMTISRVDRTSTKLGQ